MFSRIFETLGAKNAANTDDFCMSEAENHGIYDVFFLAFGNKNQGIYSIFCSRPSKNTGIYAVLTLLQDIVSIDKNNENTVFYNVFASCEQPKIVQQ